MLCMLVVYYLCLQSGSVPIADVVDRGRPIGLTAVIRDRR